MGKIVKSKLTSCIKASRISLVAHACATLLIALYQFLPQINQGVGFGLMMIIPTVYVFAAVPFIVTGALTAVIAIIYWLAGVRNNILVATVGFSVSYFVVSLLNESILLPQWALVIVGVMVGYGILAVSSSILSKALVTKKVAVVGGTILLVLSLYLSSYIAATIDAKRSVMEAEASFQDAVKKVPFVSYYPTYTSEAYPASVPKYNGYSNTPYTNETVTFTLGSAEVQEGAHLEGQEKVMNFVDNCTIYRLWFDMTKSTKIAQDDINQSVQHPQQCTLLQTTPSGKKVYYLDDGNNVWFYTLLGNTNIIFYFYNLGHKNYNPAQRDELLKIVDSLQPLDKSRLYNGNSDGTSF